MSKAKKVGIWALKIAATTVVAFGVVVGAAMAFGWSLPFRNNQES